MICLDSDFIIDFLKGKTEAARAMRRLQDQVVTTEINRFEILFGVYAKHPRPPQEQEIVRNFFDVIDVLPFDEGCGEIAAKTLARLTTKGQMISQNDALIAATMAKHGCHTILTRNVKHYARIPGINAVTY